MEVSDVAPSGGQAVPKSSTMLALSPFQVLNICSSDCWRRPQGFPMISTMQEMNSKCCTNVQALLVYSATPEGLLSPSFANEKLHLET